MNKAEQLLDAIVNQRECIVSYCADGLSASVQGWLLSIGTISSEFVFVMYEAGKGSETYYTDYNTISIEII